MGAATVVSLEGEDVREGTASVLEFPAVIFETPAGIFGEPAASATVLARGTGPGSLARSRAGKAFFGRFR